MHVNGHNEEGSSKSLKKNGLKILNKWIQNPRGRKPKQWDLFYAPVPLFWITCWPEVSWDVSTRASSKFTASPSEELGNWRQMLSLPFASFANWRLFCKAAATLTRIPNACLHWRDHINVNDVWYTDVSHIYRYITHKQMYYTQMYYTQRCIIHRISGQRNTQDSDWKQKAQLITTSEKKACVCSQRITQLNVKRSLYAWLLPAPLSLWKRFGGVSNNLWTFQGVPQNQQSEDIPLQVKSSS